MIGPVLPWFSVLWFVGVVLFSLRLLVGFAAVERLRGVGLAAMPLEIAAMGEALTKRLAIRRTVKFATSALVQVPTMIGYLRPLVLLPAVPLTGLSTREIEFLLAHELAHVRRHDYLHNILQCLVETLLFYHPAMWWVSSIVRRERENCCDDLVVYTLHDPKEYALALVALEQRRSLSWPSLAASDGRLLHRIRRLISKPSRERSNSQLGKGLAGVIVLISFSVAGSMLAISNDSANASDQAKAIDNDGRTGDRVRSRSEATDAQPPKVAGPATGFTARALLGLANAYPADDGGLDTARIVVGPKGKLTFDGEKTTWDALPKLLEKVSDREKTILEVAISTDDLSVREMNDAIAKAGVYANQFKFKYSSYIGVHPFGSKGTKIDNAKGDAVERALEYLKLTTRNEGDPTERTSGQQKSNVSDTEDEAGTPTLLKLPGGGSVELVGVSAHHWADGPWWAPDGTPLKQAPFASGGTKYNGGDRLHRHFAFRFKDAPSNIDLGHWSMRVNKLSANAVLFGAFDADGRQIPDILALTATFEKGTEETNVTIGVAARPRTFVLSVDWKGKKIAGSDEWLAATTKVRAETHEEEGGFEKIQSYFAIERPEIFDFDIEVVAIDLDGNKNYASGMPIYPPKSRSDPNAVHPVRTNQWGYGFSIPLARVKEFRVLARSKKTDYDWFTFENVSLQPGHRTQPKARIDQVVDQGPQSQRVVFKPRHGIAGDTNWTELNPSNGADEQGVERLIAHVALEGEFPVRRHGDTAPIFKVKLMAGRDESLNVKLTRSDGVAYNRVLQRGKPLSWKLNGKTYQILYPDSAVALDTPPETPMATIVITCRDRMRPGDVKKSIVLSDGEGPGESEPPEETPDDSKGDGGSDLLRNIRASAAPILAEMAETHGYGLEDGEAIRIVRPPYPELRKTYYRVGHPTQWEAIPRGPDAVAFHWIDGQLENWGMTFGDGDGYQLKGVIGVALGLKEHELAGAKELLAKRVPGDVVIRPGQPDDLVVKQLEKVLQKEMSLPVRLEFRDVERKVYVARGDYKLTPLPGHAAESKMFYADSTETTDPIEIFGEQLVPNSGSGGGTGDFAEFLQWLGDWIDARIVDETGKHPTRKISWSLHGRSPATEKTREGDHAAELVLKNITKQTGLRFTKEMRPVRVLFVESIGEESSK
jgi:uncharacterized protein (TIGR03435 family)